MGGITGIQYFKNSLKFDQQKVLEQMLETISHRAPYYMINHSFESVSFGVRHHQLNDLSQALAYDVEKGVLLIMDGDIFRCNLEGFSNQKKSGDAELLLNLYLKKGERFVDKIDGTYSIAIWNAPKNQLLLIRDRVGCKPLFYHKSKDSIVFSSEIKAIVKSNLYDKSVNLSSLNHFLSYWYVPNPDTLFNKIFQVKPGHMVVFENGKVTEKQYWKFEYKQEKSNNSEEYYKHQFLEVFTNAVSRRLKKYPNCGAFLSGGLDSSSVSAVMYGIKKAPFKVFSGGFEEEQYNEIDDAKAVSDHLGIDLNTVIIDFNKDFFQLIENLVWHHDSPFADTSAVPSYYAAKLAKEHVDVVFTGDFPDQLIGGSGHHAAALKRQETDSLIHTILRNKFFNSIALKLPLSSGSTSFFDRLKRFFYRETFSIEEQRIIGNMPVPELLKRCLYSPELLAINKENNPLSYAQSLFKEVQDHELLDKLLYFDILSYAPDDLMVKVDRMTSAHGLIAISPFYDLELLDFVAQLPTDLKIKGQDRKYIMREAMRPMLPVHTMEKQKKGFDMPLEEWLIQKDPNFVTDVLFDSKTLNRGYFNKSFLQKMVTDFLNNKTDYATGNSATIISLITLELWHRMFID